ncbi:terminase large subunit domain-containing protein [Gluconobacter sp. OJB]|uniref:terminase large subunit n=1 Tax=Gluconobacter sp. OJB TaxID=3145196 RepID=UPI0031F754B3
MNLYPHKEDQNLFNSRNDYLKYVTKEEYLENQDYLFYMRAVQNGTIPACEYVKAAVQREQDKFDAGEDCDYFFDAEAGWKFFAFCRYNSHLTGPLGGTPFILSDWQIWVFSMLLGWKRKGGQKAGFRQYNIAYLECPRGSGKSAMMALFGLYMLTLDDEWNPEVYVAATKKEQANLLFNSVIRQVEYSKNRKLMQRLKVRRKRESLISYGDKGGSFVSLSKDSKSFDGMNVHCALVDELHAHPTSEIWDVLNSGSAKRDQAMMIGITTAGTHYNWFGYQQSNYIKKLLKGEAGSDDSTFCCIWTIDKGDDFYDPNTWIKANPSWWASINHEKFSSDIERTRHYAETRTEVYTKFLNVWYHSNDKWLNPDVIYKCNNLSLSESDFQKVPCIIGIDLSESEDMTALVNVYEKWNDQDGKYHYYVFPRYFLPDDVVNSGRKPRYNRWDDEGLLELIPGQVIDYDIVQGILEDEWHEKYVLEYAFDRYNATQMAGSLQNKFGDNSVRYINQSTSGLNEASKFFKRLILEERIHFHNEIFIWNCLNCTVKNSSGLIKISKDEGSPADKIDGVAACINALDRFLYRSNMDYSGPSVTLL